MIEVSRKESSRASPAFADGPQAAKSLSGKELQTNDCNGSSPARKASASG
jgi:hypothetical protein